MRSLDSRRLLLPILALAATGVVRAQAPKADGPKPIPVNAPAKPGPASYAKDVADVLAAKCVGCHSSVLAENRLDMEEVAGMLKGGKRGPAIVPGKADESLLFKMAAHRVEPVMPPADKKDAKPLTPEELGLLKRWIDSGAKDDSEENAEPAAPIVLGTLPPGVHPVGAVDLNADGTRVAAGRANVVQVFEAETGVEIIALGGHKDIVQSVRFSPDGRVLAAGSYQIVTLWNVPTGGAKATFTGHGDQVKAIVALPGGKGYASTGLDKTIRFWDRDGKPTRQANLPAAAESLAVSPDGATMAVGGADNLVRVVNVVDGKELHALKGHSGPVTDVAFVSNGSVASASADGTARVWTVPAKPGDAPAEPVVLAGAKTPVRALAASPDGFALFAAGDDGKVRVWKATGGEPVRTIDAHAAPVLALRLNPAGNLLLTGSADKTAKLIDLATGATRATLGTHLGAVNAVAFSPDGTRVVTAGAEGAAKVWDVASGQGVIAFGHAAPGNAAIQPIQDVLFDDAGSIVSASADKTLRRWGFEGSWSERPALGPHAFRVLALDFNPDGTLLAAGGGEPSRSGEVRLWEVGKGLPVRTLDGLHSDTVFDLRFSPDGSKLASAGADKFLKVSRVADGKELKTYEGHTHHVMAVDWKADGKQLITGGADNVLKLWDAESGEQVRTLTAAGKQVTAARWVAGKPEVVGASGDKQVRVWNPDSGGVSRTFSGPSDFVFAVAASKDGKRLAGGGADGALFLWDRESGQVKRKIDPPAR